MQIDLLLSPKGEAGLVSNRSFDSAVSGAIFDLGDSSLTLEFGEAMDSLRLNIPVADDFVDDLKRATYLHICAVEKGRMTHAIQVPLMKVSTNEDDFFHEGQGYRGIIPLQSWLKDAKFAQSVHRDNLADTGSNGGIMHREGLSRATLQVAPQLAQQLVKEQALVQRQGLQNVPRAAPPSLGPGTQSPMRGPGIGNVPRGGNSE